jgi:tetratricopeptide (TPR) repeat protein
MRRATLLALFALAPALAAAQESTPFQEALERLEAWDVEGAAELVRQLEKTHADDSGTKFLAGRVAFELGDYDRAVTLMREALGPRAEGNHDYQMARGAQREAEGTVVEESAHFTVRYKPGKDAALVPYTLETMEAAYDALVKDLDYVPPGKVRIELYGSPKALARVSSLSEEAIKTTGTIALCKYNRLMVTTPRALIRGYEWQDTLVHEFVHFMVTRKSRNTVPIWLHEGIAKYLETRWRGPAGEGLDPGAEVLLAKAVKKDALIPFAKMHPSIALLPTAEDAALAFAQVFTAIQYVDQKAGMAGVRRIIDALREGKTDREAVAAAVGGTFEQFEAGWKKALKTRPYPKSAPPIEKLVFKDEKRDRGPKKEEDRAKSWERGELAMLPNADARRFTHLGDLMRARKRFPAAAIEYEKAIAKAGPSNPALARKYALTMLQLERLDDAEKVLRASLAVHADDATNNLLLGNVLLGRGKAAEAKHHFLVANRRDPFDPEIHAGLLRVAQETKDAGLEARERDVLKILAGDKRTWRAPPPGTAAPSLGWLRIEAPSGARVFIDGVDTGLTTPVEEHALAPGTHVVRLELADGEKIERTIEMTADQIVPFPQS